MTQHRYWSLGQSRGLIKAWADTTIPFPVMVAAVNAPAPATEKTRPEAEATEPSPESARPSDEETSPPLSGKEPEREEE